MDKQRLAIYREMLAELKAEKRQIEWQIGWIERKVSSVRVVEPHNTAMLFGDGDMDVRVIEPEVPVRRNPAAGTQLGVTDTVELILTEQGIPLHAKVILQHLHQRGRTQTTMKSLTGSMPQDSKHRFENLGKNVWALRNWPDHLKDGYRPTELIVLP